MKLHIFAPIMSTILLSIAHSEEPNGKELYFSYGKGGCVECHGETGNEPVVPIYPKIGGQSYIYLYKQMLDYKNGLRTNGLAVTMQTALDPFTKDEIKAIAEYLSQQKPF